MYNIIYLAGFVQGEDGWVLLTVDEQLWWTYPYCMSFHCLILLSHPTHLLYLSCSAKCLIQSPQNILSPSVPLELSTLVLVEMPHSVIPYTLCQGVCPPVTLHTPKGPQHSS